jgi:hypothetical protein
MDSVGMGSNPDKDWTLEHLKEKIFVNLMGKPCDEETKSSSSKYVLQFIDKFKFFRRRSPSTFFEIDKKDLCNNTIKQINNYTKECKTKGEIYSKINGVIVEVIARIAKQAEPEILSSGSNDDVRFLLEVALSETRETVSHRWILVDRDKEMKRDG